MQMQGDIVHRHRLQAELTLALHFHAVDADVLLAEVIRVERIAGNHARFVEIETAIAIIQAKQRQNIEQVDLFAIDGVLRPGWIGAALRGNREVIPAADKLINLLFNRGIWRQAEGNRVVLPGTDGVHRHAGIGKAANIIKPQRGRAVADTPGGVSCCCQIRLGVHFFADFQ